APGNVPFVLSLRSCLYPLAAGNTCVLKTSELCPRAHLCMAQALLDAGLPKGALSVIHVDPKDAPEVTEAMISHRWVRKVNFTGSTRVGRIIAQTCAKHLKPCVLELGGKAPVLVLEDADLDVAANNIVFGGFFNANQVCMATNNILVHSSVADLLESKISEILQQRVETFTASSLVEDGESRVRCLFNDVAAEKAKSLYDDAISKGAKVVAGKVGFERSTVQPLVLGGVDDSMRIFEEETFAPILSLIRFQHVDQAVEMANANPAGLAASIFTSDLALAFSLAKRIDSGQVHINGQTIHDDPMMPHGGWKESGYGRFNGVDGIRQFTQTKGVTVSRGAKIPFEYM
ncbi:ALDH-like protein, partial [Violaceomyces palustris]